LWTIGNSSWINYSYSLKAKKLSGSEGFLILFNVADGTNWIWWNIGGWNNTQTGIEYTQNGTKSLLTAIPMTIQSGQWYDISIQLGDHIRCYLNGQLIHDVPYPDATQPLLVSSSLSQTAGDIIVKAVNVSPVPLATTFSLNGLAAISPQATFVELSAANPLAENSLATPTNVVPQTGTISIAGTNFLYTLPANSLSIFRLQTRPVLPIQVSLNATTNVNDLASLPDGIPVSLSSFSTIARPFATVSACALALNHCRILARARGLFTKPRSAFSQSRDGPPDFAVTISTRWPLASGVSSGTIWPSTRAPRQRCPRSLCSA